MLGSFPPEIILINLIVLGIAMTVHEFAHNYVGHLMGDPVPKSQGRLTLNPLVHINWVGWLMFAIVGFGILGSAPIAAQRMRNPRWGFLAAVAAGPLSNLGLAIVFAIVARIFLSVGDIPRVAALFLYMSVFWNVLLFVFNILPFFPIDGWHIVLSLLPGRWLNVMQIPVFIQQSLRPLARFLQEPAYMWQRWQTTSYYIFLGLIFISIARGMDIIVIPDFLGMLISQPTQTITGLLIGG